jgi:tetratricopeptide (TPR) repeat protein
MNDMELHERSILASQGYLELGMFKEVWKELQDLPPELLARTDVLEILALSLMGESRWEDALKISQRLRAEAPDEPSGFIHEAYCLHELGRTQEALDILLAGPESLQEKSVFFYNAGCYHARLGDFKNAVLMLEKSFALDASLKRSAKRDPDLFGLKGVL